MTPSSASALALQAPDLATRVFSEPAEWRVVIPLDHDAEEASYVYDLVASARLQTEKKEYLPLPFRGQFLFKVPLQAAAATPARPDSSGTVRSHSD